MLVMSELDIENHSQLAGYLRAVGRVGADELLEIRTLTGGVSNRTVLVERSNGVGWVIKQALPKLRVEVDWFCDPERIRREALGLRWLERLLPAESVPKFVMEDREQLLFIMEAVPQPHENWKTQLLDGRLVLDSVTQFAAMLATLHRRSAVATDLPPEFQDRTYFEALRLEPYYAYAASQVTAASGFLDELLRTTRQRRQTLVHGDYSPKNVLVWRDRLVLLDHEVIHWGDPGFDIGFAMTHLLSKAHHLRPHREEFATAAQHFWQVYRNGIGDGSWQNELEPHAVRHTLGCLLARVAGRSPLEYLLDREVANQREAICQLLPTVPTEITVLVERFLLALDKESPGAKQN